MNCIPYKRSNYNPILPTRMIITNLIIQTSLPRGDIIANISTRNVQYRLSLMMILFTMTGHYLRTSKTRHTIVYLSILDPTSYLRYKDYIVGGISEWTKPEIDRVVHFLRESAWEEGKRIGQGESSSSFLPSFLPLLIVVDPPLLADAYEADVKTFVKYEGTARGRSIRRHPRG